MGAQALWMFWFERADAGITDVEACSPERAADSRQRARHAPSTMMQGMLVVQDAPIASAQAGIMGATRRRDPAFLRPECRVQGDLIVKVVAA